MKKFLVVTTSIFGLLAIQGFPVRADEALDKAASNCQAVGDAGRQRRQYALFQAEPDQRLQRQEAAGGLDIFHQHAQKNPSSFR